MNLRDIDDYKAKLDRLDEISRLTKELEAEKKVITGELFEAIDSEPRGRVVHAGWEWRTQRRSKYKYPEEHESRWRAIRKTIKEEQEYLRDTGQTEVSSVSFWLGRERAK